jgi:hypothetical protein
MWVIGLNAKDISKEIFPVCGAMRLSCQADQIWVEKCDKRFIDDEDVEMEVWNCVRKQSKDFYAMGFDGLVK